MKPVTLDQFDNSLAKSPNRDHRGVVLSTPLIAIVLLFSIQAFPHHAIAGTPAISADPLAETKDLVDRAIAILREPGLSLPNRRHELKELADSHLDFADMARSALGYHWRDLSEEQRTAFVPVFRGFIEDAYLNKIQEYSGQRIEIINQLSDGPDYASVNARIVGEGDRPIALAFRLRRVEGAWKTYDLDVDSISITANYRTQFSRIVNNQGFDKLVGDLKAKQAELDAMVGKAS